MKQITDSLMQVALAVASSIQVSPAIASHFDVFERAGYTPRSKDTPWIKGSKSLFGKSKQTVLANRRAAIKIRNKRKSK